MQIALVTETYVPEINGVAKTLARLVEELLARDHNVHVIRPAQKSESRHSEFTQDGPKQTLLTGLPIPGYAGLQFGLPAGRKLRQLWNTEQPDIIYVATEGPLGWSAVKAANRCGIPVISGFHTNFDMYSRHYHLGFLENLIFGFLKKMHNRTLCTLAPSPQMVEDLRQRGISDTCLFSRGVDTRVYSPTHRDPDLRREWQQHDDDLIALYVGRIAAEKNIDLLLAAFDAMRERRPHSRLVMVGDGPMLAGLRRQRPDVVFPGPRVGADLSRHYASADVFLFASETETFGNVVLEAMSSGLALVAYDYAATQMHVRDRENGIAVTLGDADAFIQAVSHLSTDDELLKRLQQQARQSAEQVDWKNVIDLFEQRLVTYVKPRQRGKRNTEEQPVSADGSA